ncbi:hypothetical protein SAMN02745751_03140 [Dethiosulfatibacter aminovorans DSM 17477]|uniref:Wadjet protein JetD C-terminal domain-containing protein n=1 Tax=Dethiosulfatibacter aminovorans DSM 17477 TaxID=1121476 RepID=A0A1M6LCN4_9FIRM|nr:Wadjet anti-phage system protein JetD domain-containing protein [Dethiosulfatibacter aminovorans]SHJ68928.1 hypothetical protein SAMN02745751_03140 [Dethiosulfatibacter aminovorans DSM 17477]
MEYKKFKEYILENFQGKRVDEKALRAVFKGEYDEYYNTMNHLVDDSIIKAIKRSGPNGLKPTLHKRYQVLRVEKKIDCHTDEIKGLHPVFNIDGYLANTSKYISERDTVLTIDNFIRKNGFLIDDPASINERSFQIFGKEKMIRLDSTCKSVFSFNRSLENYLNMYHTPEPFFEHSIDSEYSENQINVLIIENKDTWYTLRKLLNKGNDSIYGIRFNSLIFGEGKKIIRKRDSLTEFAMSYYDQSLPGNFYYFGDLDMEGIEIFENLVRVNPELKINLLKQAYLDMIDESVKAIMPDCSEDQQPSQGKVFFSYFTEKQVTCMKELLDKGKFIPQEILPYGLLKKKLEKRS